MGNGASRVGARSPNNPTESTVPAKPSKFSTMKTPSSNSASVTAKKTKDVFATHKKNTILESAKSIFRSMKKFVVTTIPSSLKSGFANISSAVKKFFGFSSETSQVSRVNKKKSSDTKPKSEDDHRITPKEGLQNVAKASPTDKTTTNAEADPKAAQKAESASAPASDTKPEVSATPAFVEVNEANQQTKFQTTITEIRQFNGDKLLVKWFSNKTLGITEEMASSTVDQFKKQLVKTYNPKHMDSLDQVNLHFNGIMLKGDSKLSEVLPTGKVSLEVSKNKTTKDPAKEKTKGPEEVAATPDAKPQGAEAIANAANTEAAPKHTALAPTTPDAKPQEVVSKPILVGMADILIDAGKTASNLAQSISKILFSKNSAAASVPKRTPVAVPVADTKNPEAVVRILKLVHRSNQPILHKSLKPLPSIEIKQSAMDLLQQNKQKETVAHLRKNILNLLGEFDVTLTTLNLYINKQLLTDDMHLFDVLTPLDLETNIIVTVDKTKK